MPVRHQILKRTIVSVVVGVASLQFANAENMTRDNGSPVGDNENSQTAGPEGPVTLQDSHLIEKLQRFDRERIPERVVHARGTGVFGEFVRRRYIESDGCKVFNSGTKTPVVVRFSTVMGYRGSPEQARDPRGFAIKFYTAQGTGTSSGSISRSSSSVTQSSFPISFMQTSPVR